MRKEAAALCEGPQQAGVSARRSMRRATCALWPVTSLGCAPTLNLLGDSGEDNADVRAALAQLENAELQLAYTRVAAPVNGYVTDLTLRSGSYANVGSPMLSLVDSGSWRVLAYLEETQLRDTRPGQTTRVQPGSKVDLGKVDAGFKDKHESHEHALPEIEAYSRKLRDLQYRM
jgi:multidrug resistance efflux pump